MTNKRNKRSKQIEAIFKKYNGAAVIYNSSATSNKSISQICSTGSTTVKGMTISELINEARK